MLLGTPTPLLKEVIAEFAGSQPGRELRVDVKGDLHGEWDRDRVAQVISNLVGNACEHGETKTAVRVRALGRDDAVAVEINNAGAPIPAAALGAIFEPMTSHAGYGRSTHLGLGLYIAREIVNAHGGTLTATSTKEAGTTFAVTLPRHPALVKAA